MEEPKSGKYHELRIALHEWYPYQGGWFDGEKADRQFNITTREGKRNRWIILERLVDAKKLQKHEVTGKYRVIRRDLEPMLWRGADSTNIVSLKWPFGLEKYTKIFRKNIIIIAGTKSAGKTAFILNFIRLNMDKYLIKLFNSEMGTEEFNLRIRLFNGIDVEEWNFEAYERSANFADVIDPDCINIIDFLEIHDNFYIIGGLIKDVFDRLENGIAIINVQKNLNADFPIGGQRALEKARLVINLDPHQLTLKEVKNWADGLTESPRGKSWTFQLVRGAKFVNITEVI